MCTGAYINAKKNFPIELLAVPVVDGKPFYNAYVIINRKSSIKTFKELSGKSFAFTDPLSNTGYNYIVSELKTLGTTPEKFFSKTIFTYAHDFSIQAVARDLVDGATVDGLVYEYIKNKHPEKVARISVLNKSRDFGMPPFVVNPNMDPEIKLKLRKIMTTMHLDIRGKEILKKIMIDKFLVGDESIYGQQ
ncbi:MAG: PhnD/SsuA/transferrin family substrate-binding protein [Ignavibacteriales bacterium]|nr:PhnD/SsuA/transferrin family substrate-binding protein [Ignavibacteriales bacterium]